MNKKVSLLITTSLFIGAICASFFTFSLKKSLLKGEATVQLTIYKLD